MCPEGGQPDTDRHQQDANAQDLLNGIVLGRGGEDREHGDRNGVKRQAGPEDRHRSPLLGQKHPNPAHRGGLVLLFPSPRRHIKKFRSKGS